MRSNAGMATQTKGRRLALRAILRHYLALWLVVGSSARGHVLHSHQSGRSAAGAVFSHRPHGMAVLRLVGCSHKVNTAYNHSSQFRNGNIFTG
jgi:hypothetical protein